MCKRITMAVFALPPQHNFNSRLLGTSPAASLRHDIPKSHQQNSLGLGAVARLSRMLTHVSSHSRQTVVTNNTSSSQLSHKTLLVKTLPITALPADSIKMSPRTNSDTPQDLSRTSPTSPARSFKNPHHPLDLHIKQEVPAEDSGYHSPGYHSPATDYRNDYMHSPANDYQTQYSPTSDYHSPTRDYSLYSNYHSPPSLSDYHGQYSGEFPFYIQGSSSAAKERWVKAFKVGFTMFNVLQTIASRSHEILLFV